MTLRSSTTRLFPAAVLRAAIWFVWLWPGSLTREANGRWRTHGRRGRARLRWRATMALARILAILLPRALTPGRWGGECRTGAPVWLWGALGVLACWLKPSALGRAPRKVKRRLAIGGAAALVMGVAAVAATGIMGGQNDDEAGDPPAQVAAGGGSGGGGSGSGSSGGGGGAEAGSPESGTQGQGESQGGGDAQGGQGQPGLTELAANDFPSGPFGDGLPAGNSGQGGGESPRPPGPDSGPENPTEPPGDDVTTVDPQGEGGGFGLPGGGSGGGGSGGGGAGGGGSGGGGGTPGPGSDPFVPPGGEGPPTAPFSPPPPPPPGPLGPQDVGPSTPPSGPSFPGGGFGGPGEGDGPRPGDETSLLPFDPGGTQLSPTPEPGAWLLTILGFGLLGARLRRRRPASA